MNNKVVGYVLAVLFGFSLSAFAQDQQQSADDMTAKMATELNLTESQRDAVKPIIKEYVTKREKILEEVQGQGIVDHAAVRSAMRALKQDEYQSLSKVLSADQMERWIQKENLRAALNPGDMESQVEGDTTLTPSGANFKF